MKTKQDPTKKKRKNLGGEYPPIIYLPRKTLGVGAVSEVDNCYIRCDVAYAMCSSLREALSTSVKMASAAETLSKMTIDYGLELTDVVASFTKTPHVKGE